LFTLSASSRAVGGFSTERVDLSQLRILSVHEMRAAHVRYGVSASSRPAPFARFGQGRVA
jgi:hypothetical protein